MCAFLLTKFVSLLDNPRKGNFSIDGLLTGSVVEEVGKGISFNISPPFGDTAPMVDGEPKIHVNYNGSLSDIELRKLMLASRHSAQVSVLGSYKPVSEGERIGIIDAEKIYF